MYPRQELKSLARLRKKRIYSIDQRRKESCECARRVFSPIRLFEWAVTEWRATQFPVSQAMVPLGLLLHRLDRSQLRSLRRILRGALVVFSTARQLDRIVDSQSDEVSVP